MSTINEILFNIKNTADRGTATRAQSFSNRNIIHWINEARGFLVTKSIEKDTSIPVAYVQDLGCITLTEVDQADCSAYEWGDLVKKAVFPDVLEIYRNMGLAFFGLIDKKTSIYVPDVAYGSLDDFARFKPKKIRQGQMIGTNTVYLYGNGVEKLCTVNVRGIFKDPTLVSYYDEQGIEHCYDPNKTQYPIPADMEGALYDIVFKRYLAPFAQAPRTVPNDEDNKKLV